MMKHVQFNTTETFPLNLQLRKINKGNVERSTFQLFSFSHTPNDSRGQETKKEITNAKKVGNRENGKKEEKKR